MLSEFKKKYRLAIENYITYRSELETGLQSFDSPSAVDPAFKSKIAELAAELRRDYPMSMGDVTSKIASLDGMAMGSYVSSFGYSIYGGANHFAICASIGALAGFFNTLLNYLETSDDVTDINYRAKIDAYFANAAVERAALESPKAREFYERLLSIDNNGAVKYCECACYPRELVSGMERLLALYPEIEKLDPTLEGMEGIDQFRRFRNEIYDAVIEAQGRFNDYPEEMKHMLDYIKSATDALGELPAELLAKAEAEATAEATKQLGAMIDQYLLSDKAPTVSEKIAKKLEKDRLAVIKYCAKMSAKRKTPDTFKVMKLSGHTIYMRDNPNPGLSLVTSYDAMKVATEGTAEDYVRLYKTSMAKLHFFRNGDPADSIRKNALEGIVAVMKADLAAGTPVNARRTFIAETFTPFYVFVGAPLLDAMFELVYMDTFADFTVLPDEFKTKTALDDLCEYFRMKRADTVKEAINLYVSECGYPEGEKLPAVDKKEMAATIAAMMQAEDYLASIPKRTLAETAISEALG